MSGGNPLKARRDQVRRHELRLAILALASQGGSMDPSDIRRELPTHPAVAVIEYHLLVLQCAGLLSSPAVQR
jgi:hypothetical protein